MALADRVSHASWSFRCVVEAFRIIMYQVTAKEEKTYERVHACLYVPVKLTLQHVSRLTLEGMLKSFLVVFLLL